MFTRPPSLGARGLGAVELSHDTRVMLVQELGRVVDGSHVERLSPLFTVFIVCVGERVTHVLLESSLRSEDPAALVTIESCWVDRGVADVLLECFFRSENPAAFTTIGYCWVGWRVADSSVAEWFGESRMCCWSALSVLKFRLHSLQSKVAEWTDESRMCCCSASSVLKTRAQSSQSNTAEQAMAIFAGYWHCEVSRQLMTATLNARQSTLVAQDPAVFEKFDIVYGELVSAHMLSLSWAQTFLCTASSMCNAGQPAAHRLGGSAGLPTLHCEAMIRGKQRRMDCRPLPCIPSAK
ncbi:hypothetical protein KC318_g71 [Hortaea werneckii]|nr:hypothetical protein KC334_g69 [Hortaea werneckii]KAI7028371.1 hypothetical protein KC355_g70 [Hortaea werneckii]KAI7676762.1 hypothetical protein KC318_g71 [Hortaea werneckii]